MDMPDDKEDIEGHFNRLVTLKKAERDDKQKAQQAEQEAQQAEHEAQQAEQKAKADAQKLPLIQRNLKALLDKRKSDRAAPTPTHVPADTKLEYMRACLCRI